MDCRDQEGREDGRQLLCGGARIRGRCKNHEGPSPDRVLKAYDSTIAASPRISLVSGGTLNICPQKSFLFWETKF
jgi:hypothetical protein